MSYMKVSDLFNKDRFIRKWKKLEETSKLLGVNTHCIVENDISDLGVFLDGAEIKRNPFKKEDEDNFSVIDIIIPDKHNIKIGIVPDNAALSGNFSIDKLLVRKTGIMGCYGTVIFKCMNYKVRVKELWASDMPAPTGDVYIENVIIARDKKDSQEVLTLISDSDCDNIGSVWIPSGTKISDYSLGAWKVEEGLQALIHHNGETHVKIGDDTSFRVSHDKEINKKVFDSLIRELNEKYTGGVHFYSPKETIYNGVISKHID